MGLPSRARLLVLALAMLAQGAAAQDLAAIDAFVAEEVAQTGIQGAALAIVRYDRVVHLAGFGRDRASGAAITPSTPFILGSTGKSITAVAVAQLAEQGRLDFDAPVRAILPEFAVDDPRASEMITLRQLLHQTSGLPTWAGLHLLDDPDESPDALARHVRALADVPLAAEPGERFAYSNANYTVLGLVVQRASGTAYESYLAEHVFRPLGMERSFTDPERARAHGLSAGHRSWFGWVRPSPTLPFVRGELPSGFQISTAEDMARYLLAHLNGGVVDGRRLLAAESIAALQRGAVEAGERGRYGMGWSEKQRDGVRIVEHGGAVAGYLSDLVLVPDRGWGVALLTNTWDPLFSRRQMTIADNVARLLIGAPPVRVRESGAARALSLALCALPLAVAWSAAWALRRKRRRAALRVPALVALGLGLGLLWALPAGLGVPLSVIRLLQPDLGWLATGTGVLSLVAAGALLVAPARS